MIDFLLAGPVLFYYLESCTTGECDNVLTEVKEEEEVATIFSRSFADSSYRTAYSLE